MRRAFTLIELLVVIAISAVLLAILLPAMAGARNQARLAVSTSNMKQIATAHEAYRAERRGAIPVPMNFNSSSNATTATGSLIGGKFSSPAYAGLSYDAWPGERVLNPFTNPTDLLPRPTDVLPTWTIGQARPDPEPGMRENLKLDNWRSPGDKRVRCIGPALADSSPTQYDRSGSSYFANIYWIEMASDRLTGNAYSAAGWRRAVRWGNTMYDRIDTSRFVVAFDTTAVQVRETFSMTTKVSGEFGGGNKSVLGFADGHAGYVEMVRRSESDFRYATAGMGSLAFPGFTYSFQMDNPPPKP